MAEVKKVAGLTELKAVMFGDFIEWLKKSGIDDATFHYDVWATVAMYTLLGQFDKQKKMQEGFNQEKALRENAIKQYTNTLTVEEWEKVKEEITKREEDIKKAEVEETKNKDGGGI